MKVLSADGYAIKKRWPDIRKNDDVEGRRREFRARLRTWLCTPSQPCLPVGSITWRNRSWKEINCCPILSRLGSQWLGTHLCRIRRVSIPEGRMSLMMIAVTEFNNIWTIKWKGHIRARQKGWNFDIALMKIPRKIPTGKNCYIQKVYGIFPTIWQCDYASSQAGNLRRHLKTHGPGLKKIRSQLVA